MCKFSFILVFQSYVLLWYAFQVNSSSLLLLQVGRDSRPVMREAYNMFKDGGDPEKVSSID